jgi:hypothetical protein
MFVPMIVLMIASRWCLCGNCRAKYGASMCKPSAGTQMVLEATIRRLFECIPADAAITVEVV